MSKYYFYIKHDLLLNIFESQVLKKFGSAIVQVFSNSSDIQQSPEDSRNYNRKLTMNDALLIQLKSPKDLQKLEQQCLLDVTLNKIMTCEYENGLCCYDKFPDYTSKDSDSSEDDDDDAKEGDDEKNFTIHPVDNLLTLIHCSDNILQQNLMSKLSLCQVAVPLLLPRDDNVTLLLWALRCIVKKWNVASSVDKKNYIESPIVDIPSPVVSFLRIGSIHLSKSDVLNHVIGKFSFFFFKGCNRVKCKKKLTEGLVDLCWYLPGDNNDNFPLSDNPVLFLNLHGDARKHKKQVSFIQKLSLLSFIFVNESEMNDNAIQVIEDLSKCNKTVLFIEKIAERKHLSFNDNVETHHFRIGKSLSYFQERIQKIITATVINKTRPIKLSECTEIAKSCGIHVDESMKDCQKAFKDAKKILDEIKKFTCPIEAKFKLFPLQGSEGWQKWAKIDRKQYQEFGKQTSDLEQYNAEKNARKMEIRRFMLTNCAKLTVAVNTFINVLLKCDRISKQYFLSWLKLLLDEYNRAVFTRCSGEMHNAAIGLEHFFREMEQIYETVNCLKSRSRDVSSYPRVMAELIADGYCMEIMDGDSTHVPVDWVSAVFKELQAMYNNSTLYTISIVGVQSSGKSTLLNTMFGLNFSVSAGRCTRGAFMQLLSFHKDVKSVSKLDHVLLIDTEGLRAPELQFISKQHDNELATFVVGLADVAIINIGGENQAELSDILQTVCHGLIRINKIDINPSCKFVHHHVTEPGAESQTAGGRKKFVEVLDETVKKACELEACEGKYNSFSEFMKFKENQDVLYFKPLWDGSPPMAKVNKQYAKGAQNFKVSLMDHADQHKCSHSFTEFSAKINLLWNAVLREQFLFSFKNTLELIVRKEYGRKHSEWNAEFRLCFLNWESQAKLSFCKDKSCNAQEKKNLLLKEFTEVLGQKNSMILKEREMYFTESKYKEILAEWEAKSNEKIRDYYQEYIKSAECCVVQLYTEHTSESEVQKIISTIDFKLDNLADHLFASDPHITLSDQILEEKFNEKWISMLNEIPSAHYKSTKEIDAEILLILQKFFEMDCDLVNQKLLHTPLIQWNTMLTLNAKTHLQIKPPHTMTLSEITVYAQSLISSRLKDFVKCMKSTETKTAYSFQGVLHQFYEQLKILIEAIEEINLCQIFQFTKECIIDVALTASKCTEDLLINFEEKARKKMQFMN